MLTNYNGFGRSALALAFLTLGQGGTLMASGLSPSDSATSAMPASKFRSDEDGAFDLSKFIDQSYGFVPIVMPITEPAVGFGGAGAVAFIDKPQGEAMAGFGRPNITAVGGLGTENGTWGVGAVDVRHWREDRLQTLVGLAYASVNLDFYGIGEDSALQSRPLGYNLKPVGGIIQTKLRISDTRWWAGLGYSLSTTQVRFDAPTATPGLPSIQRDSRVGGLKPSLTYDSRNTIFTPTKGSYLEANAGFFSEAFGGESEFQRLDVVAMHFVPLHPKWTLGVRADSNFSFGDEPFYLKPSIHLRGVPAMRYQGEQVAQAEVELRWQFWRRYSLLGFTGGGVAWNDFERFSKSQALIAGGAGVRYELARKYGLHMGVDLAVGQDGPAVYVQFGSAWGRP